MGCASSRCCTCAGLVASSSDGDAGDAGGYQTTHHIAGEDSLRHVLGESSMGQVPVPSHHYYLQFSYLTQQGYYPDSPDKDNQDSFCIKAQLQGNPNLHFFGVFDGHGQFGAQCSSFVKDRLVQILSSDSSLFDDPVKAYNSAFIAANNELHESEIDDSMSGTTAITVLVVEDTLYVANVGDSRAVMGVVGENHTFLAKDLSTDQTPFRRDEYERVKQCGARVLSVDQVEGIKDPDIQTWGSEESDDGDPPRLWVQNGMYPGTAFTRSVGDSTAENIGVVAQPEVMKVQLNQNHLFFVIASDGVFEFLPSQVVVDMVVRYTDPQEACAAIAADSYKLWLEHENRTDDITIIIVHIKDPPQNSESGTSDGRHGFRPNPSLLVTEKGSSDRVVFMGSENYVSKIEPATNLQPCSLTELVDKSASCVAPNAMQLKPIETGVIDAEMVQCLKCRHYVHPSSINSFKRRGVSILRSYYLQGYIVRSLFQRNHMIRRGRKETSTKKADRRTCSIADSTLAISEHLVCGSVVLMTNPTRDSYMVQLLQLTTALTAQLTGGRE